MPVQVTCVLIRYCHGILSSYAAPNDYHSLTKEVELDLASRKSCISIAIINDGVPELTEEFFVQLSLNDATELATVIIADNDGMLYRWSLHREGNNKQSVGCTSVAAEFGCSFTLVENILLLQ